MKLKLTLQRSAPHPSADVVVTTEPTAHVGDVARELLSLDPLGDGTRNDDEVTLAVAASAGLRPMVLSPEAILGEAPIASGCVVSVVESMGSARSTMVAATMRIESGPDAGRQINLPPGTSTIGRDDAKADIVLNDQFVSKLHARVEVGATIELVDLNSANGIVVDGSVVSRLAVLPGQRVQLGDTQLSFLPVAGQPSPTDAEIRGGAIGFNRSPRVEERYPDKEHPRPSAPSEPTPQPFPWLMMIAPVFMGTAMYTVTGNPMSLLFVLMAPMMMTSNYMNRKLRGSRQLEIDSKKFMEQLRVLEERLRSALPHEQRIRQNEVPAVARVYQSGLDRSELLWTRRPEHWTMLSLRLGQATLPSRHTISEPSGLDDGIPKYTRMLEEVEERYRLVPDVPVVEALGTAGALGIVGGHQEAADTVRATLVQLAGLHSPAEVVLTAIAGPDETPAIDWMRWLPHTSSPQSPIQVSHLVDTQTTATALIADLERIVDERLGRKDESHLGPLKYELESTERGGVVGEPGEHDGDEIPPLPAIVVLVTEDAPIDRPRAVQLFERAHQAGVYPVWVGATRASLPAMCRTFVDVTDGLGSATAHFVRHGIVVEQVRVEGVSLDHARRFAMALSPLADVGAVVDDSSDLPSQVSLVTLLGNDLRSSGDAVLDRWRQNLSVHDRSGPARPRPRVGTLRALVGQASTDAMHLDLRTQGPHALVGGTTGSGKSEFLQAWVLGMAAEYSPDRVTFLFVDYKGGAAFADCVKLPHCVGLVTDLSEHLVRRALTSLRAELHYRERLLQRKRAKDLLELEKRGDPESPPALILVVDEFAALVSEVPEFVDGVVDIAQRGRSLGIHLILATQRPAGVIKDNLRANTNLRIALRMADESDSSDVIGSSEAAHFDPTLPGRGVAKTGPGRLMPFQSAYAGGHTTDEVVPSTVHIHQLKFGAQEQWRQPEAELAAEMEAASRDPGPTDQVRLVDAIGRASLLAELPEPRRPWLDELSDVYDLSLLGPRTDTELLIGVADYPEHQAQKVVTFRPDTDGNLLIFGVGGAGKTVLLRTLAAGAGVTPRGGPVHVYGIDYGAGGLRMLEPLPHVGSIVGADDDERIVRLLRSLRAIADQRARDYPTVHASSITEYRVAAGKPEEPRILLLIDNFPAFKDAYESGPRAVWFHAFQQLLNEGRQLGIHVIFTADRPGSVPGSISSSAPRRVVMRLADEAAYLLLGMPSDILTPVSPPGRAVIDRVETQVAVLGGSGNAADQSQAIGKLARAMERQGVTPAPPVRSMPSEVDESTLPNEVDGKPVLGIGEEKLEPIGFEPSGTFMIGGGPSSGRSNAIIALARSVHRWRPAGDLIYLGHRRSSIPRLAPWTHAATDLESVAELARSTAARVAAEEEPHIAVFVESISDFLGTPADAAIVELIKAVKRSGHLLVAETETGSWGSMYPLLSEVRNARRGMLLQPESIEGETLMRTPFPRSSKREFPPGRGMAVLAGKPTRIQVPWAGGGDVPIAPPADRS